MIAHSWNNVSYPWCWRGTISSPSIEPSLSSSYVWQGFLTKTSNVPVAGKPLLDLVFFFDKVVFNNPFSRTLWLIYVIHRKLCHVFNGEFLLGFRLILFTAYLWGGLPNYECIGWDLLFSCLTLLYVLASLCSPVREIETNQYLASFISADLCRRGGIALIV